MSISRREVESSEIGTDNATFHDLIAMEVSHIFLEDSPGIIGRITNRMIVKFEEQTTIFHATIEIVEATREGNIDV